MATPVVELDGSGWTDRWDFWWALHEALGTKPGHGTNFAAFEDSVFYAHELLTLRPPFTLVVRNPTTVTQADVELMAQGWAEQRAWKKANYGEDVEAELIIQSGRARWN